MRTRILITAMMIFVLSLSLLAQSDTDAKEKAKPAETEKARDIRRLMMATGSGDLGVQVINQMIASFKASSPRAPEKFWDDFRKEISAEGLIEKIIPVYDKYLSHDDVKELIRFYETPLGKKLINVLPQIAQESMAMGQAWGEEISKKIVKKMEEQGYK